MTELGIINLTHMRIVLNIMRTQREKRNDPHSQAALDDMLAALEPRIQRLKEQQRVEVGQAQAALIGGAQRGADNKGAPASGTSQGRAPNRCLLSDNESSEYH